MVERVHAISGLPRSGSTLLAAVLNQNPRFSANMTSPVYMLVTSLLEKMSPGKEFSSFFDDKCRTRVLRSVFDGYYYRHTGEDVVFDTNRLWPTKAAALKALYPNCRLICCVRHVGWVIDSIERMLKANPLQTSRIFGFKPVDSIYVRVQSLMNTENGLIGLAWSALHEAWFAEDAARLIVVKYESFVQDPAKVIESIYKELGEKPFRHDFENVNYAEEEFDASMGMPGMHTVRRTIRPHRREPAIPPEIFSRHTNLSFWDDPENNPRGVLVI
jgi:sulfotransferase